MSSTNIYPSSFTPTYLYIKQHSVTGKLYFGKTTKSHSKMLSYTGSGIHWDAHINAHGKKHVVTLWYCLFLDQESITDFALKFSEQQNIVESEEWLNLCPENGLDGRPIGVTLSAAAKAKISFKNKGRSTPRTFDTKVKISNSMKGKIRSEEHKLNLSKANKGKSQPKLKCTHCGKACSAPTLSRWHGNNCKNYSALTISSSPQ